MCLVIVLAGCLILTGGTVAAVWAIGFFRVKPNASDIDPAWSPDGGQITFASDRNGNYDIYVMRADGSKVVQLTRDPFAGFYYLRSPTDTMPVWSPDGEKIAFISGRSNGVMMSYDPLSIYVMNANGSHVVRSVWDQGTLSVDRWPAWSPEGSRIVFASQVYAANADVYLMNEDGSSVLQLTKDEGDDTTPAWSPDGGRIAFLSNRDGNYNIYVMNADGSDATHLTRDVAPDASGQPAWSPDGSRIAFAAYRNGNTDIYVMDADGSNVTRLTSEIGVDNEPAWSPDGSRIAFVSNGDGDDDIYLMNADGSNLIQLTN
jgi:Tol biopolymer transport system component